MKKKAYILVFVWNAKINGLFAVKNGFRAHEAHSGWILISRNKMKFENLWKNYLNMTKGLLVFILVVEINGLSTFKNSQGWIEIPKIPRIERPLSFKRISTSENSITLLGPMLIKINTCRLILTTLDAQMEADI